MLPNLVERTEHLLFDSKAGAKRPWGVVLRMLRYPYALAHDISRGELTLHAMSLVYTTLLSTVPLLALSFSVLKGLGYHRNLEPVLSQFLEPMGARGDEITNQIMQFVENASGGVLGTLGFAFLLYTTVSMIQKVEESFNRVWRVQEPRSVGRRISEYLSVLIVGPIAVITAIGILATLSNYSVMQSIAQIEPFGTLLLWFGHATPYLLIAGVFAFLYSFIPNTKVQLRAALVGGIVAGVLWVASGVLFASFVGGAGNSTVLIYAGFAIVLLALFWLHISWLILLVGAQLAFYVQYPQCLRPGSDTMHLTASASERIALSVMHLLARDFTRAEQGHARKHFTLNSLAEHLFLAVTALAPIVRRLESAGLILVTEDDRLVPGRDLDSITLIEVLDAVRNERAYRGIHHVHTVPAADAVADRVCDAIRASVQHKTLKDLIAEAS
jgi:membrane protein